MHIGGIADDGRLVFHDGWLLCGFGLDSQVKLYEYSFLPILNRWNKSKAMEYICFVSNES